LKRLWSTRRREVLIAAGVVLLVAVVGVVIAYNALKRPGDVSNADAPFTEQQAQVVRNRVEWPDYGYDAARTRFLFEKGIKPPFRKIWQFGTNGVLTIV